MNTQTISGTVTKVKQLNNSHNGNPNYRLAVETDNGHTVEVGTLNDYGVNYKVHYGMEGQPITLKVKVNKYSNKLLDIIKGAE